MRVPGEPSIALVVAVAENGVIGRDGGLPWRLRDDLQWFKRLTMGHPMVMGRKTYDGLPRPLPGRSHVVLSRHPPSGPHPELVTFAPDLDDAFETARGIARRDDKEGVFVIGGAELYLQALPLADVLYLTRVHATPEGDTLFDVPSPDNWNVEEMGRIEASPGNDYAATIERWRRA